MVLPMSVMEELKKSKKFIELKKQADEKYSVNLYFVGEDPSTNVDILKNLCKRMIFVHSMKNKQNYQEIVADDNNSNKKIKLDESENNSKKKKKRKN